VKNRELNLSYFSPKVEKRTSPSLTENGFLVLLCILSTLYIFPTQTEAQQRAQTPRIGFLWIGSASPPSPLVTSFQQDLRDLGWIDGQNVIMEYRYAEGKPERFDGFAAELAHIPVEVIVAPPAPAAFAAKEATSTIPIVITLGADPVALQLVYSLDRPGGNVTGLDETTPQLTPQRLSLLKEIVPGLVRVAILRQSSTLGNEALQQMVTAVSETAESLKVSVDFVEAKAADDLEAAFETIAQRHADGLIVLVSPMFNTETKRITGLSTKHRLPATYEWRTFVAAGGAVSYGADLNDIYRRAAGYVDKILKGATVASLPVAHPTKLELVVDLNHAKEIGMVIPGSVLRQADQVLRCPTHRR
jgi:putative ABC transport system substrate-binding protein